MPLIKCPDCGNMVSDRAAACIHCGCPISATGNVVQQKPAAGTLTIYGLRQTFLIGGTVKIYVNGQYYDSVKKGQSIQLKIARDCEITAKCGINPAKGKYTARAGVDKKLQIVYDRLTGSFMMKEVDVVI